MALLKEQNEYGEGYRDHLLEQWGKCVEMANSCSDKRISSNNVYITINAALLAVINFTSDWKNCLLAIVGIVVCILWLNSIRSYRALNAEKYRIINEIEEHLPAAPYSIEWDRLKNEKKFTQLTRTEAWLPWVFIAMFVVALVVPLGKSILIMICPCILNGGVNP